MAIFLIFDHDPEIADTALYWRGDIVDVFEDTKPVIVPPCAPFLILRVTGLALADARKYVDVVFSGEKLVPIAHKRLYCVRLDNVPTPIKNALATTRYYEVAWSTIRAYVENKLTGTNE